MADNTPRLNLGTYAQGDEDWSHNDTVEALDELAIDRGPSSSRPTSGDYDHQMFYDLDQRILWRWDAESSDWNAAGGLGADVENFSTSGAADTVPVSQGDGTLSMQNVTQANVTQAIEFLDVESPYELPDPGSVSKPTIAYVDSEDDYVGVFKQ